MDDLESELQKAPTSDDLSQLRDAQKSLQDDVKTLQRESAQAQTALDQLRADVKDLGDRVDALEQQQGQATPSPTP
jgi:septal ring factor EnvC (AmiA/AmiB activator)